MYITLEYLSPIHVIIYSDLDPKIHPADIINTIINKRTHTKVYSVFSC